MSETITSEERKFKELQLELFKLIFNEVGLKGISASNKAATKVAEFITKNYTKNE